LDSGVVVLCLEVPGRSGHHVDFGDDIASTYASSLQEYLGRADRGRVTWSTTPMAAVESQAVGGELVVYDMMDELGSFLGVPARLRELERQLLDRADLVFAGGHSLFERKRSVRPDIVPFPSGVEPEHYAPVRRARPSRDGRPVAGYVGVIDERIDLTLLRGLATELHLVGPVVKVDQDILPKLPNVRHIGFVPYPQLPAVMSRFTVGIMPFARNQTTALISPTKTLEYLAAGVPVVSTPINDVMHDFATVVDIADDVAAFATACRLAGAGWADRQRKIDQLLRDRHWDVIVARMSALMRDTLAHQRATRAGTGTGRS
jgi:glycosyltransferase involved in cell wall biosynthesis